MSIASLFPTQPPDYQALAQQAQGMVGYGKTITSILRNKVTAPGHESFAAGMQALNGVRAAVNAPAVAAFEEGKAASDQVRSAIVQKGLEPYTEAIHIGKEIGAFVTPRAKRAKASQDAVPDVGASAVATLPDYATGAVPIHQPTVGGTGGATLGDANLAESVAPPPAVAANCPPGTAAAQMPLYPNMGLSGDYRGATNMYAQVPCGCLMILGADGTPGGWYDDHLQPIFIATALSAAGDYLVYVDNLVGNLTAAFGGNANIPRCPGSFAPPPPPPQTCPPGTGGVYPNCYAIGPPPPPPVCPPGTVGTPPNCVPVGPPPPPTPCCPEVKCPTLEIPQTLIDCICEIATAVKDFKTGGIQPISVASGAAGTQEGDYDTEEQWTGKTQQVPVIREPAEIEAAFAAAKFLVDPSTLPPPPASAQALAAPTQTFLQSFSTNGSGGGGTQGVQPGIDWLANILSLDWNAPEICLGIEQLRATLNVFSLTALLQYLGVINADGWVTPIAADYKLLKDNWSVGASAQAWVLKTTNNLIIGVVNALDGFFQVVARQAGGQLLGSVMEGLVNLVTGPVQRWLGFDPEPLLQSVRYAHQAFAPRSLPTAADATAAFLRNQITFDLWKCWVTANNQLPGPAEKVMLSLQQRPDEGSLIRAYYRGFL